MSRLQSSLLRVVAALTCLGASVLPGDTAQIPDPSLPSPTQAAAPESPRRTEALSRKTVRLRDLPFGSVRAFSTYYYRKDEVGSLLKAKRIESGWLVLTVPPKQGSFQNIDYFSLRIDGNEVPLDYQAERYGRAICAAWVTQATREVEVEFSGTASNREIRESDRNPNSIHLTATETQRYTNDYTRLKGLLSPQMRSRLAEEGLLRKPDESTFAFVVRALDHARNAMGVKYNPIQERTSNNAAEMFTFFRVGECDNLCDFTTIILRGNGIPTRETSSLYKNSNTNDLRAHLAMDFFSNEIGAWVPVDPTEFFAKPEQSSAKLVGRDAPYSYGAVMYCSGDDTWYDLRKRATGFPPRNLDLKYTTRPRIFTARGQLLVGDSDFPDVLDYRRLTIVRDP